MQNYNKNMLSPENILRRSHSPNWGHRFIRFDALQHVTPCYDGANKKSTNSFYPTKNLKRDITHLKNLQTCFAYKKPIVKYSHNLKLRECTQNVIEEIQGSLSTTTNKIRVRWMSSCSFPVTWDPHQPTLSQKNLLSVN